MKRLLLLSAATAGALALGACGLKGDLVAPGPMWGDPNQPAVTAQSQLPSQQTQDDTRIVFTRDDVDLFRDEAPAEDPFGDLPLGPESDRAPEAGLDSGDSLADEDDD